MKQLRRRFVLYLMKLFGKDTENFAPHGVQVHIPAGADVAIRYLLARGRPYEAPEAMLISRYVPKGANVIELGGCMGVVSALIRQTIGPDAKHVVVEANPDLVAICKTNATRYASEGAAEVVQSAVDYSGKPSIAFAKGHNAHVGRVAQAGEAGFTVPTTTLSSLAAKLPEGRFALVCDIEGAELALVENEAETLRSVNPLILETHPGIYPEGQADLDRMCATLASLGLHQVSETEDVICFRRTD